MIDMREFQFESTNSQWISTSMTDGLLTEQFLEMLSHLKTALFLWNASTTEIILKVFIESLNWIMWSSMEHPVESSMILECDGTNAKQTC